MLESWKIPGEDALAGLKPGQTAALTGVNATMAAVLACRAAQAGKKILLVTENDLKASRAADDARQLSGNAAFLPGGEIDLTRAAGSLESSWRRLEALSAVCAGSVQVLCTSAEAMAQRMGRPEPFRALSAEFRPGDRPKGEDLVAWVLGRPGEEEKPKMEAAFAVAAECAKEFAEYGVDAAMRLCAAKK